MFDYVTDFAIKKYSQVGEVILGLFGITWGLWLLNPTITEFELRVLSNIQPVASHDLGLFMLSVGTLTVVFSLLRNYYILRKLSTFVNMFSWWFIAMVGIINVPSTPSIPVYIMIGVYSLWLYIKLVLLVEVDKLPLGYQK